MNYKHLDEKKKAQIDILHEYKCSTREIGRRLNISHSTVSRYLNKIHKPRSIPDIHVKYKDFIKYLIEHYDWRVNSIEACVYKFKKYYPTKPSVSAQQVYNWINDGKIEIQPKDTCYKRRKKKKKWNDEPSQMESRS